MLKGIDSRIPPQLLYALAEMGHGDVVAIVDRNYPAEASGVPVIHLPGLSLAEATSAVLSLIPVDTFVETPMGGMSPTADPTVLPDVQRDVFAAVEQIEGRKIGQERIERFDFYERARDAYVMVATGETLPYGCILIAKGVI